AKRVLTAIARPLENIGRQAVEPENAFYSLAAGGEPLVAGAGAVVTPIEKTLGKIVKWLVAGQLASNVPSSTAHRTKEVEQNPEHPYLQALESSVGSAGDVGLPLLVAKSAVKDDVATSGLRSRDFDSSTPSGRELILANAREGLPNNPQEIQRKIIANAFEQAAYRAKAGEARRGETQQLAPGQKPEVDEALMRMNELKQEADRLYGQLELAKREATLAKQEQAVREGSLAAPEARGEAPVIGEPIYGENLVQPEVAGGEIKPVYQAAGEPKQGGQVSFGSEASAGGVPSARQAGHEGAFGGAEQPKGVIPQVVDIVTSKDRLALNEMRNAIRGAEEGTQQAPGAGVARATDFDLARLIDSRIRELKTGTFDPELSKIRATISPVPKTKTLTAPEVEAEPVQEWGKVKSGAPTPQGGAKLYMGLDPEEIKRSLRPAIRLMSGRLVVGEQGETHNDIIAKNKLDATQIDRRTFELNGKEFTNSREEAAPLAEAAGIKTETQPGRL